jgi:hypothetical protein
MITTRPSYVAIADRAFECRDRRIIEIPMRKSAASRHTPCQQRAWRAGRM